MGDGTCCHYCRRYECECPDDASPKTPRFPFASLDPYKFSEDEMYQAAMWSAATALALEASRKDSVVTSESIMRHRNRILFDDAIQRAICEKAAHKGLAMVQDNPDRNRAEAEQDEWKAAKTAKGQDQ